MKVLRRPSIRQLRLKPRKFQTRTTRKMRKYRKSMKKLTPIIEETDSQKKSVGGRHNLRKTKHSNRSTW